MNENIRLEWFKPDLTAPLEVPLMDSGVHAGFPSPADDSIEQPFKGAQVWLVPANEKYKPIEVTTDCDFRVWGVVRYVIKKVKK